MSLNKTFEEPFFGVTRSFIQAFETLMHKAGATIQQVRSTRTDLEKIALILGGKQHRLVSLDYLAETLKLSDRYVRKILKLFHKAGILLTEKFNKATVKLILLLDPRHIRPEHLPMLSPEFMREAFLKPERPGEALGKQQIIFQPSTEAAPQASSQAEQQAEQRVEPLVDLHGESPVESPAGEAARAPAETQGDHHGATHGLPLPKKQAVKQPGKQGKTKPFNPDICDICSSLVRDGIIVSESGEAQPDPQSGPEKSAEKPSRFCPVCRGLLNFNRGKGKPGFVSPEHERQARVRAIDLSAQNDVEYTSEQILRAALYLTNKRVNQAIESGKEFKGSSYSLSLYLVKNMATMEIDQLLKEIAAVEKRAQDLEEEREKASRTHEEAQAKIEEAHLQRARIEAEIAEEQRLLDSFQALPSEQKSELLAFFNSYTKRDFAYYMKLRRFMIEHVKKLEAA